MSTHITPVEAITSRLNQIPIKHGNLIFDSVGQTIYYDSLNLDRIEMSSIIFATKEEDIKDKNIDGIDNKIFLCRDTGAVYYYFQHEFHPILATKLAEYTQFYVSPDGNKDNDGLTKDTPLPYINNVFEKYPDASDITIYLSAGHFSNIEIKGIGYLKLIGASSGTEIDYINIDSSSFYMTNISSTDITLQNTKGIISKCFVDANDSFGIKTNNSNIYIEYTQVINSSKALVIDQNSYCTAFDVTGENNNIGYTVVNGSILNVFGSRIGATALYRLNTLGKIYFEGDKTDISTKEYIKDQLDQLDTEIGSKLDSINFNSLKNVNDRLNKIEEISFITAWQVDQLFEMSDDPEWGDSLMIMSMSSTVFDEELQSMFDDSVFIPERVDTKIPLDELKLALSSPIYDSELEMLFDENNTLAYITDTSIPIDDDCNSIAEDATNGDHITTEELQALFR